MTREVTRMGSLMRVGGFRFRWAVGMMFMPLMLIFETVGNWDMAYLDLYPWSVAFAVLRRHVRLRYLCQDILGSKFHGFRIGFTSQRCVLESQPIFHPLYCIFSTTESLHYLSPACR